MRRRRGFRRKVIWMQNPGTAYFTGAADIEPSRQSSYIDSFVGYQLGAGHEPTVEVPLVLDQDIEKRAFGTTLASWQDRSIADSLNWGYLLRRIVGKLYISVGTSVTQQSVIDAHNCGNIVSAGIIVRRTDPDTGIALQSGTGSDVAALGNITDPWIWRRVWKLKNSDWQTQIDSGTPPAVTLANEASHYNGYPVTTAEFGSVADGPNVDTKIKRRIGPEERLFLDVSFRLPTTESGNETDWECSLTFDYRVLASVIPNSGNRRNASR